MVRWARERFGRVYAIRLDRDFAGPEVEGVDVVVVPARDLRTVFGGDGPAKTLTSFGWKKRLLAPFQRLKHSFPFLYLTDDGGPIYRRRAFARGRALTEAGKIDTLFSSYGPWTDHLVARSLKQRFPQLRWIADFRDLPVDPIRDDVWFPALQRWWARRMLDCADEVWCVSEGQAEWMRKIAGGVKVYRHRLLELPPAATAPATEKFTIVYTGSLYPKLQGIGSLVTAIRELCADGRLRAADLEFVYRGKDGEQYREWLAELPAEVGRDIGGYVPMDRVMEYQHGAQLLLLLNWSAADYYGVLLAKTFDYLATGRPILGLTQGPVDPELTSTVECSGAGRVFASGQERELHDWLLTLYGTWKREGSLPWRVNREALRPLL